MEIEPAGYMMEFYAEDILDVLSERGIPLADVWDKHNATYAIQKALVHTCGVFQFGDEFTLYFNDELEVPLLGIRSRNRFNESIIPAMLDHLEKIIKIELEYKKMAIKMWVDIAKNYGFFGRKEGNNA